MASTSAHLTISNFKFKLSSSQSFEYNSLKPNSLPHLKSFGGLVTASKMIKLSARSVETSPFRSAQCVRRLTVLPDEEDQFDTSVFKGLSEFCSVFMAEDFEAVINSLSKWLITIYFIVVLAWRSDAKCLWGAMGCFVNAKICGILKHIFKQERPASTFKSDPGMPSSHAQSIFYIFMTSNLSVIERLGVNEVTLIITGLTMACGSYFSWLRVSQHFHTMSQVVVGAFAGSVVSILWSWAWDAIVLEAFISFWWVRTIVIVGAISFFLGIILEAMQNLHSQKQ